MWCWQRRRHSTAGSVRYAVWLLFVCSVGATLLQVSLGTDRRERARYESARPSVSRSVNKNVKKKIRGQIIYMSFECLNACVRARVNAKYLILVPAVWTRWQ